MEQRQGGTALLLTYLWWNCSWGGCGVLPWAAVLHPGLCSCPFGDFGAEMPRGVGNTLLPHGLGLASDAVGFLVSRCFRHEVEALSHGGTGEFVKRFGNVDAALRALGRGTGGGTREGSHKRPVHSACVGLSAALWHYPGAYPSLPRCGIILGLLVRRSFISCQIKQTKNYVV